MSKLLAVVRGRSESQWAARTIGVLDQHGGLLRWITRSDFRRAGRNTEYSDGRDQDGKFLPPGEYTIKAVYHEATRASYRCTPTASGLWR